MPEKKSEEMVEVVIDSIRVSLMSQQRIVILREVGADRYLPIWIGPYEAEAITIALQQVETARPLTHDLLYNVIKHLGARVLRVEVLSLREEVYYGNIVAEANGTPFDVDARPSDALALSVRANCPILVARKVIDQNGVIPEDDLSTSEAPAQKPAAKPTQASAPTSDESGLEDRLSVFEDFLDNLDFDADDEEKDQP